MEAIRSLIIADAVKKIALGELIKTARRFVPQKQKESYVPACHGFGQGHLNTGEHTPSVPGTAGSNPA
jgi:hypothetical protein